MPRFTRTCWNRLPTPSQRLRAVCMRPTQQPATQADSGDAPRNGLLESGRAIMAGSPLRSPLAGNRADPRSRPHPLGPARSRSGHRRSSERPRRRPRQGRCGRQAGADRRQPGERASRPPSTAPQQSPGCRHPRRAAQLRARAQGAEQLLCELDALPPADAARALRAMSEPPQPVAQAVRTLETSAGVGRETQTRSAPGSRELSKARGTSAWAESEPLVEGFPCGTFGKGAGLRSRWLLVAMTHRAGRTGVLSCVADAVPLLWPVQRCPLKMACTTRSARPFTANGKSVYRIRNEPLDSDKPLNALSAHMGVSPMTFGLAVALCRSIHLAMSGPLGFCHCGPSRSVS